MANLNEMLCAVLVNKLTNATTLPGSPTWWKIPNLNRTPWAQKPVIETDANEIGHGHEFAEREFKSHYENGTHQLQYYGSVELLTWMLGFGLGKVVKTGTTPNWTYTITPVVPATDGLELPYTGYVQQIRPGGTSVLDQLYYGVGVEGFRLSVAKGPGRGGVMASCDLSGTGKYLEPSAVTVPALATFHDLLSSMLTVTINGVNYVTAKTFESFDLAWTNNFRPGFYPGSGTQDGFAVEGRKEVGDRACGFSFVARFENGSTELTKLKALTSGTAQVTLTYDANNSVDITFPSMSFQSATLSDAGGLLTVQVTGNPKYDPTNGIISAVCKVSGSALGVICQ